MWWLVLALAQEDEPPPLEPAPTALEWQRICDGDWPITRFTADVVHTTACFDADRGSACRTVFGCEGVWRLLRTCGPPPVTVGHPSWPVTITPGRAVGPRGEVLFDRADACEELNPMIERSSWVADATSAARILSVVGPLVSFASRRRAGARAARDPERVQVVDLRGGDPPSLMSLVEPESLLAALRQDPRIDLARNRRAASAGTVADLLAAIRWNADVPSDVERSLAFWAFEAWNVETGRVVVRLAPDEGLRAPRLDLVPSTELAGWLSAPGAVFVASEQGWRDLTPPW